MTNNPLADFVENVGRMRENAEGPHVRENDQYGLRQLGYTGELTADGYVVADHVEIPADQQAIVTNEMVQLLAYVTVRQKAPVGYFLQTTAVDQSTAKFRANWPEVEELVRRYTTLDGQIPARGSATVGALRYEWGPVPTVETLTRVPDPDAVREFPDFYIGGPGRQLAEATPCRHLYRLTGSCPGCDADLEEDATKQGPTGRERPGEHWNARLLRCQQFLAGEVRQQLTETDQRLRDALELAYSTARQELDDVQRLFRSDIGLKGPVRATRLHATRAMKWRTTVAVWEHAMEIGKAGSGWDRALDGAESIAIRLLRESVTPTRNAVDGALATVQGRTAESLLDTIASFRATIR